MDHRIALFGKHPAWPDFMELGIPASGHLRRWIDALMSSTERVLTTGRWGVPGQESPASLMEFGHTLVWAASGPEHAPDAHSYAVARLWASMDARGRRLYPLIAMQTLGGSSAPEEFAAAAGHLGALHDAIGRLTDAEEVTRQWRAFNERSRMAGPVVSGDPLRQWRDATRRTLQREHRSSLIAVLEACEEAEVLVPVGTRMRSSTTRLMRGEPHPFGLRVPVGSGVGMDGSDAESDAAMDADAIRDAAALAIVLRDALVPSAALACFVAGRGVRRGVRERGGVTGGARGGFVERGGDGGGGWIDVLIGAPTADTLAPIRIADGDRAAVLAGGDGAVSQQIGQIVGEWAEGHRVSAGSGARSAVSPAAMAVPAGWWSGLSVSQIAAMAAIGVAVLAAAVWMIVRAMG